MFDRTCHLPARDLCLPTSRRVSSCQRRASTPMPASIGCSTRLNLLSGEITSGCQSSTRSRGLAARGGCVGKRRARHRLRAGWAPDPHGQGAAPLPGGRPAWEPPLPACSLCCLPQNALRPLHTSPVEQKVPPRLDPTLGQVTRCFPCHPAGRQRSSGIAAVVGDLFQVLDANLGEDDYK